MCRNIRVLYNFKPPTTEGEIRDAALQYVRKVSGIREPSTADQEVFDRAVADISASTTLLLAALTARAPLRTREGEKEKAREKWKLRAARIGAMSPVRAK
ncbi:MAG: DUF2277 domain-containing protein [Polyangiaceae bacterium]